MGKLSGKAKEVAGAVTGNDSLTAEGRLQQAEVTARQEAATDEAVADAQRTEVGNQGPEPHRSGSSPPRACARPGRRHDGRLAVESRPRGNRQSPVRQVARAAG